MKSDCNVEACKAKISLTLNQDLVNQVTEITGDLSGVVESLLAEFVAQERTRRSAKAQAVASSTKAEAAASKIAVWNEFNQKFGSFADGYSPLR
jgi:hypothetical protein